MIQKISQLHQQARLYSPLPIKGKQLYNSNRGRFTYIRVLIRQHFFGLINEESHGGFNLDVAESSKSKGADEGVWIRQVLFEVSER
jgi:hypothetical protein